MALLKKTRISEQVAEEILRIIAEENLKPGDRFHSEQQLCAMLGVSRSSIREALRSLETTGWITVRQGKGIFIASTDAHENEGFLDWLKLNRDAVLEHFEVRMVLDPKAASQAALRASTSDIKDLDHICAEFSQLAQHHDTSALIALDEQFHYTIARCTRNRTLSILMKTMAKTLPVGWITSLHVPGRIEKTVHEHCAIVEAIRRHDPEAAEKQMIAHLWNAQAEIIQLIEGEKQDHADHHGD